MLTKFTNVKLVLSKSRHVTSQALKAITISNQRASYSSTPPGYWDYTNAHGPTEWQKQWNFNKRQSPIDILTKLAVYNPDLEVYNIDRVLTNYKSTNTGLNISTVPVDDTTEIILTGGALPQRYRLREFHFHWAEVGCCGCEHTLNGHRFAAELHLVHWNVDLFKAEGDALGGNDGLAVLGVFLDASSEHAPNEALSVILEQFHKVAYKNMTYTSEKPFTPYSLLPENTSEYFTYPGSLTTPPLTENVTWTVFRNPLKISLCQLEKFNRLFAVTKKDKDKKHEHDFFVRSKNTVPQPPTITNNFRPVQPLRERIVQSSFQC